MSEVLSCFGQYSSNSFDYCESCGSEKCRLYEGVIAHRNQLQDGLNDLGVKYAGIVGELAELRMAMQRDALTFGGSDMKGGE